MNRPGPDTSFVERHLGPCLDALSFLTCLVPPRELRKGLAPCMFWFAPAGCILGCFCTLAAACIHVWLLQRSLPVWAVALMSAWLWLCLAIWLTRALHWDGLADLADACGSGAQGERFWQILRDSRLGAMGALAMLTVFCGQWICLACHISLMQWWVLVLAPAWGRACAVWLAAAAPPREVHSLGGVAAAGAADPARCYVAGLVIILPAAVVCGMPWWQGVLLPAGQYLMMRRLIRTAEAHGGLSGDFLGAAVELGQLWFLLVLL
ncbi:MAG: adenosylcobinamide-GDP ribazoletransferase [Desulfovibrio sp.]|nr:adenosylcobinamide-GDP ribazoletransferase [Desulfovibrio sp.]